MIAAAVFAFWAASAGAVVPAIPVAGAQAASSDTPRLPASGPGSSTAPGDAQDGGEGGLLGEGWVLTGGYFFKDTLFYSRGRGGPMVSLGKTTGVFRWLGIWTGTGLLTGRGTQTTRTADGVSTFRSSFDESVLFVDVGVVTPWLPFPVSLSFYWATVDLSDEAVAGPFAGSRFSVTRSRAGAGVDVRVQLAWFPWSRTRTHRGLGLVGGYVGFMDLSPGDISTESGFGGRLVHSRWKPFAGEGLQAGLEYEF